ncbi:hypothetical protein HanRHA438_Chr02g0082981 [Helianthus annuus]|nr:hypothetical protein HanRHA438_Chr02g0082981 [Helianthus annuus]
MLLFGYCTLVAGLGLQLGYYTQDLLLGLAWTLVADLKTYRIGECERCITST